MQSKHADREKDKPCILTIAMLGTNEHRNSNKTLLTQLIDSIQTGPNQFKHLIDGLGGGSGGKAMSAKKGGQDNPRIGSYTFECKLEQDALVVKKDRRGRNMLGKFIDKVKGLAYGKGHNEAIAEVLMIVETLLQEGKKPIVLNLAGFSRGADTLLRAVNELSTRYTRDEVVVNLFAIDPVPGAGRHAATRAHFVPDIVNDMQVILMQDDHRTTFKPLTKADLTVENPAKTRVAYHIYNGIHSSPNYFYDPRNDDPTHSATQDPARLASAAITSFAIEHGSALDRSARTTGYLKYARYGRETVITGRQLTPDTQLASYTRMALRKAEYSTITSGEHRREFTHHRSDYLLHGVLANDGKSMHQEGYFLDRHHMELFQAKYPLVFDYFFQHNSEHHSKWLDLRAELTHISADPDLKHSLEQFMGFDLTQKMVPPRGIALVASDLYGQSKLNQLWEGVQTLVHAIPPGESAATYQKKAEQLYQNTYRILVGPGTAQYKEAKIIKLLQSSQENSEHSRLFNYRANNILHQLGEKNEMGVELIRHLMAKLEGCRLATPLIYRLQAAENTQATVNAQSIVKELNKELKSAIAHADTPPTPEQKAYIKLVRQCLIDASVGNVPEGKSSLANQSTQPEEAYKAASVTATKHYKDLVKAVTTELSSAEKKAHEKSNVHDEHPAYKK